MYLDCFKGIGFLLRTNHITSKPDDQPAVNAPDKWPIPMHNHIKDELSQVEKPHVFKKFDSMVTRFYQLSTPGNLVTSYWHAMT